MKRRVIICLAAVIAVWGGITGNVRAASPALQAAVMPSFADLIDSLMPSVVNISTITKPDSNNAEESIIDSAEPEFRRYFENGRKEEALGSGFIIDKEGYIITNAHVINDAEIINVTLWDDTLLEAKVVGKDPKTDIALIKINTDKELKPAVFGDSDKARVGDWILAIGNPFGLGGSVTAGIISAKSRDIESGQYDNFLQTDASINQGSSGGPMFNMAGEVIGINSVIFSTNGASMGIGFAIPINLADWVIGQLKQFGEIRRGWIGIKIQPNDGGKGVLVSDVTADAPAQKAGLTAGDVLLEVNGQEIENTKFFSTFIAETPVGNRVDIKVENAGKIRTAIVIVQELKEKITPKTVSPDIRKTGENEYEISELGLKVMPATGKIPGLKVVAVAPQSEAETKGLKAGDIIVKIDKKDVPDIKAAEAVIYEAKIEHNRPVLLLLQTGEEMHFAALKLIKEKQ